MSWLWVALLACAVTVLAVAEWPKLERRVGVDARRSRERVRRKQNLRLLPPERSDSEEFAASVERDLELLPTIDEREEKGRGRRRGGG